MYYSKAAGIEPPIKHCSSQRTLHLVYRVVSDLNVRIIRESLVVLPLGDSMRQAIAENLFVVFITAHDVKDISLVELVNIRLNQLIKFLVFHRQSSLFVIAYIISSNTLHVFGRNFLKDSI